MALMLAVTRRIPQLDARMRSGEWPRGMSAQLENKTLELEELNAALRVLLKRRGTWVRLNGTIKKATTGRLV